MKRPYLPLAFSSGISGCGLFQLAVDQSYFSFLCSSGHRAGGICAAVCVIEHGFSAFCARIEESEIVFKCFDLGAFHFQRERMSLSRWRMSSRLSPDISSTDASNAAMPALAVLISSSSYRRLHLCAVGVVQFVFVAERHGRSAGIYPSVLLTEAFAAAMSAAPSAVMARSCSIMAFFP